MTLSQQAWNKSSHIIDAIRRHPFNLELMQGTLARDKFAYYIEQDTLYLRDFARCHAIIASKAPIEYVRRFLHFSDFTFIAEQEVVHRFFREMFNFSETGQKSPATISYTSYILRVCALEPIEVAIAAVLPCFWVYREVGVEMVKHSPANNPFARWIETYAGEDFDASVNEMIAIFDQVAEKATDEMKSKMLDAFYTSTCLEWHFWHDAYHQRVFDHAPC